MADEPLLVLVAFIVSPGVSPGPLAPSNVYLTNQGRPDRLSASWGAAAGERDGYTLTLYHARAGTVAANASLGKGAHKFTFSGLAPGHKYLLEVASAAGPYRTSAGNISDWTSEWWEPQRLCPAREIEPCRAGGGCTRLALAVRALGWPGILPDSGQSSGLEGK